MSDIKKVWWIVRPLLVYGNKVNYLSTYTIYKRVVVATSYHLHPELDDVDDILPIPEHFKRLNTH